MVLGTRGTLKASVAADTQTVYFRDDQGAPVVTYAGLKVWDADGKVLPSRFVAGPSGGIILRVDESSALYLHQAGSRGSVLIERLFSNRQAGLMPTRCSSST